MTTAQRVTYLFMKLLLVIPASTALLLGMILMTSYKLAIEEPNKIIINLTYTSKNFINSENI